MSGGCCICLQPLALSQTASVAEHTVVLEHSVVWTCGHAFHSDCIQMWLANDSHRRSCPVCRRSLQKTPVSNHPAVFDEPETIDSGSTASGILKALIPLFAMFLTLAIVAGCRLVYFSFEPMPALTTELRRVHNLAALEFHSIDARSREFQLLERKALCTVHQDRNTQLRQVESQFKERCEQLYVLWGPQRLCKRMVESETSKFTYPSFENCVFRD